MKTIVIGLGNPILGDDGVGWKVAEEVKKRLTSPSPGLRHRSSTRAPEEHRDYPGTARQGRCNERSGARRRGDEAGREDGGEGGIEVEFLSLGGISLMEHLIGYERAILVDAITSDQEIGSVIVSKLSEIPDYAAFHTTSTHDTSLQNALKLGKAMGASLPREVTVVGIVTQRVYDFSEELSPPILSAIPKATKVVIDLL
jgi:hydrogenase maturation protease